MASDACIFSDTKVEGYLKRLAERYGKRDEISVSLKKEDREGKRAQIFAEKANEIVPKGVYFCTFSDRNYGIHSKPFFKFDLERIRGYFKERQDSKDES